MNRIHFHHVHKNQHMIWKDGSSPFQNTFNILKWSKKSYRKVDLRLQMHCSTPYELKHFKFVLSETRKKAFSKSMVDHPFVVTNYSSKKYSIQYTKIVWKASIFSCKQSLNLSYFWKCELWSFHSFTYDLFIHSDPTTISFLGFIFKVY